MKAYKQYDSKSQLYYIPTLTINDKLWIILYKHTTKEIVYVSYNPSFMVNLKDKVINEEIDISFTNNLDGQVKRSMLKKILGQKY